MEKWESILRLEQIMDSAPEDSIVEPIEPIIDLFFQLTEAQLKKQYPLPEAERINTSFQLVFQRLLAKYSDNSNILKNDAINPIFLIALHESQQLTHDELVEQMLAIYREMLTEILLSQAIMLSTSEDPWRTFVETTKATNKELYENDFFRCKTVIDQEQEFGFDIHRCVYYEVFKEEGYLELAPLLCQYDFILAESISDWVEFQRDETIAEGFNRCTFRYFKKSSG